MLTFFLKVNLGMCIKEPGAEAVIFEGQLWPACFRIELRNWSLLRFRGITIHLPHQKASPNLPLTNFQ